MKADPHLLTMTPMTKKTAPATKMPASADGNSALLLGHQHRRDEGEAAPEVARQPQPLSATDRDEQEDQGAASGEEDGGVRREADQHRHDERRPEHGQHVLEAQTYGLGPRKPFVRRDHLRGGNVLSVAVHRP